MRLKDQDKLCEIARIRLKTAQEEYANRTREMEIVIQALDAAKAKLIAYDETYDGRRAQVSADFIERTRDRHSIDKLHRAVDAIKAERSVHVENIRSAEEVVRQCDEHLAEAQRRLQRATVLLEKRNFTKEELRNSLQKKRVNSEEEQLDPLS